MPNIRTCLNCQSPITGPICSQCGQKADQELAVKPFIQEFFTKTSELDFRFVRVLRDLLIRPGTLIHNYLNGKRIIYTNPFKSLFIIATVYAFIIITFDIPVTFDPSQKKTSSAVVLVLNYFIFIFLALTSFVMVWLFKKKSLNWVQSYISLCYCWSGYLLYAIILALLSQIIPLKYEYSRFAVGLIYLIIVLKNAFDFSWWSAIWRALVIFIAYFLSSVITMGVVIFFSFLLNIKPFIH